MHAAVTTSTDVWRTIPGWPEYQIRADGAVRSISRIVTRRDGTKYRVQGGLLQNQRTRARVHLRRPGERRHLAISTLVAAAFGGL